MWVEQSGNLVYVIARNGFTMDDGRLILSLREARVLREELICLNYYLETGGETDEDG